MSFQRLVLVVALASGWLAASTAHAAAPVPTHTATAAEKTLHTNVPPIHILSENLHA